MRCYEWQRWGTVLIGLATVIGDGSMALGQAKPKGRNRDDSPMAPLQRTLEAARGSTNAFHQPEDWGFSPLSVLNIRPTRVTIPGAGVNKGPLDFEVLTYNGRPFGPTIEVRRGATFRIRVRNHLQGPASQIQEKPDRPHSLSTTNLHTHGLHISPADPSDNVLRCVEPGDSYTYEYQIPADHPSGTYWYHPHNHGSTGYQSSNGLAGALIVVGSDDDSIVDLEEIPEIAAARDRIFLFQQYNWVIGTDGVARIDAATIYNPPDARDYPRSAAQIDLHDPDQTGQTGKAITLNGVVMPEIRLAPGEVQRWRFIHAGIELEQNMVWTDEQGHQLTNPDPDSTVPQFFEIAQDGLATGDLKVRPTLSLYPGYRSDVLVQAPPLPAGVKEAVYLIKSVKSGTGFKLRPREATEPPYLAKVVVRGRHRAMRLPDPATLRSCRPHQPIADGELTPPTISPGGVLTFKADDNSLRYTTNNKSFHETDSAVLRLGTAQEWTLKARDNGHPFHIHVNSFQVTKHLDATGQSIADGVGEWKDTLFIPQDHTLTIRSRYQDFAGQTVFHCHILDHEDQGMMVRFKLQDGIKPLPPQVLCHLNPDFASTESLRSANTPAPALCLSGPTGIELNPIRDQSRPVVLVFIQGIGCSHCVLQLRDLIREVRESIGTDVKIVAISGQPVADRNRALATLEVKPGDPFHLFVDTGFQAFRDFGCYDGGPLHGLFVVSQGETIRGQYIGATPHANPKEVVRLVRTLSSPATVQVDPR